MEIEDMVKPICFLGSNLEEKKRVMIYFCESVPDCMYIINGPSYGNAFHICTLCT